MISFGREVTMISLKEVRKNSTVQRNIYIYLYYTFLFLT